MNVNLQELQSGQQKLKGMLERIDQEQFLVRRQLGRLGADRPPGVQRAISSGGEPGAAGQRLSVREVRERAPAEPCLTRFRPPRAQSSPKRFDYGMLPPRFFAHLRDLLLRAHLDRRLEGVPRTE